jgi:hypothetical protein
LYFAISILRHGTEGREAHSNALFGKSLFKSYLKASRCLLKHPSTNQSPMSVLIPRIRTINVRLSEEEYLELERFCVASGARSISDLVRNTMNSLITSTSQDSSLASSVIEYSGHVRDLEKKVKELASELESFRISDRLHFANGPDEMNEIAGTQQRDITEVSSGSPILAQQPLPKTDS